jgi:hypothetical protein
MAHRDQGLLAQLLYHFSLRICMLIIVKNNSSNSSYILVEVIFCCVLLCCVLVEEGHQFLDGTQRLRIVLRWNSSSGHFQFL